MPASATPDLQSSAFLECVALPSLVVDSENAIQGINEDGGSLLDCDRDVVIGQPVREWVYPGDREQLDEFLGAIREEGKKDQIEIRFLTSEKKVIWVLLSAGCSRKTDRGEICLQLQEIQGLREIQQRLRGTEGFLRLIGGLARMGTWELDLESFQLYWSPQTYEIHEVDRAVQPKLEDAIQFYAPEARDAIQKAVKQSIEQGQGFDLELPLVTAKGRHIYVHAVGHVEMQDGKARRLYGIFQDVTKSHELHEQLKQMKEGVVKVQRIEALGVMTSGIAHDFNNITASIQGNAEIMASRLDDAKSKELMQDIIDGCGHARNLVNRILAFTRTDQKETRVKAHPAQMASRVISLTRPLSSDQIDVKSDVPEDMAAISVDPNQVEEALVNLVYNSIQAIEATGQHGEVTISAEHCQITPQEGRTAPLPGDYVVFHVRDNGPGIPSIIMKNIFQPFFTTKSDENVGLGLPMVQEVMKSHAGAVTVESDPGKETCFHLYFPAEPDGGRSTGLTEKERKHILLIDDEAAFLKMMERALEAFEYQVTSFRSPLDGIKAFQVDPMQYDLVVTDLDLPWLDGKALAKQIHDLRADIPVILVSGCSWKIESRESDSSQFAAVLTKPFSLEEMQKSIEAAIRKKTP